MSDYVPNHRYYQVFVPKDFDRALGIKPGSAMVSPQDLFEAANVPGKQSPFLTVDYEGNLFGAENLQRFVERVHHAAGRADVRYPTVARAGFDPEALVPVGRYDLQEGLLTVTDEASLKAWLGGSVGDLNFHKYRPNRPAMPGRPF